MRNLARWPKLGLLGLGLLGLVAGYVPPAASPLPTASACTRFWGRLRAQPPDVSPPPEPALPLAPPRRQLAFRHAVHTLVLDETVARLAQAAGFDTVVQVFPWRDFNPERGVYRWEVGDAMVREARAYGLDLVVRLDMPPAWASQPDELGLPFDLAAYAAFVEAAARRYRGHILGYIVWNEPNLSAEWSRSGQLAPDHWEAWAGWVADPADYVGVVGVAYARIRAADPGALVVAGGLAPTNEFSERAVDDREFLRGLYAAGLTECYDGLAVHDYGNGLSPEADREANAGMNLARVLDVREIMQAYGASRPVWITELGYTLQSGSQPAVTAAEQAAYLVGAFRRVRREWPWIEMLTVWNLSYGRAPEDEQGGYSLLNPDATPRRAYLELQALPK